MSAVSGGFHPFFVEGVDAGPCRPLELRSLIPGGLHLSRLSRTEEVLLGGDGILDAGDVFALISRRSELRSGEAGLAEVVCGLESFVGVAIQKVGFGFVVDEIFNTSTTSSRFRK